MHEAEQQQDVSVALNAVKAATGTPAAATGQLQQQIAPAQLAASVLQHELPAQVPRRQQLPRAGDRQLTSPADNSQATPAQVLSKRQQRAGDRQLTATSGGALLHVDTFAHNKSGIAYQGKNRRSETVVNHKQHKVHL
jgi:hypothetical protein